jgi:polyvinyl alcohol dehydrogenase (cytochrome)
MNNAALLCLLLACFPVLAAAQSANLGYASFITNNNDSRYFSNSTLTGSNIGELVSAWNISSNSTTSTPMVLDGNVYFTDWNGFVYSANIADGAVNWKTGLGSTISSTPAVANGMVYVGMGPFGLTRVYALSQANGSVIWNTSINTSGHTIWSSPILYNGMIFIGTGSNANDTEDSSQINGGVYALNAITGRIIWGFNTMIDGVGGATAWGSEAVDPKLNSIYLGTGNAYEKGANSLYAYSILSLNASSGSLNWYYQVYNSFKIGGDSDFGSTPNLFSVTVNGITYNAIGLGNKNGIYYILNRVNGNFIEEFRIGSGGSYTGIIGLAGFIYKNGNASDPELVIPAHYNATNERGNGGVVEAIYPSNGTMAWRFYTPGNITGSVAIIPNALLVGDTFGNVYALSLSSGTPLFHAGFWRGINAGIGVADGYILVPTSFGTQGTPGLFAYSLPKATSNASLSVSKSAGATPQPKNNSGIILAIEILAVVAVIAFYFTRKPSGKPGKPSGKRSK